MPAVSARTPCDVVGSLQDCRPLQMLNLIQTAKRQTQAAEKIQTARPPPEKSQRQVRPAALAITEAMIVLRQQ